MEMILNLPKNYVEIEEEEMMYLDGGVYVNNSTVRGILFAVGGIGANSVWAMKTALSAGVWSVASKLAMVPVIGKWCAGLFVGYYYLNTGMIVNAFFGALVRGRGMDVSVGWWYGVVPYADFSCR
ncbi:MAG: hypothetical protein RR673_09780 [Erysipelotrichaceae bacterium]